MMVEFLGTAPSDPNRGQGVVQMQYGIFEESLDGYRSILAEIATGGFEDRLPSPDDVEEAVMGYTRSIRQLTDSHPDYTERYLATLATLEENS